MLWTLCGAEVHPWRGQVPGGGCARPPRAAEPTGCLGEREALLSLMGQDCRRLRPHARRQPRSDQSTSARAVLTSQGSPEVRLGGTALCPRWGGPGEPLGRRDSEGIDPSGKKTSK